MGSDSEYLSTALSMYVRLDFSSHLSLLAHPLFLSLSHSFFFQHALDLTSPASNVSLAPSSLLAFFFFKRNFWLIITLSIYYSLLLPHMSTCNTSANHVEKWHPKTILAVARASGSGGHPAFVVLLWFLCLMKLFFYWEREGGGGWGFIQSHWNLPLILYFLFFLKKMSSSNAKPYL